MAFKDEYPHLTKLLVGLAKALVLGCVAGLAVATYGSQRYKDGVEQGRAQQLCEIGGMAKLPNLPPACRRWLAETTPKDTLHDTQ